MKFCLNTRERFAVTLGAALSLLCADAFAQQAASAATAAPASIASGSSAYATPTWSTYYGTVDAIRADSQKTLAEIENLKLHHQLDQARRGIFNDNGATQASSGPGNVTSMPGQPMSSAMSAPAASVQREALVQQVSMVDGRWTASIELASGARVTVHPGDAVRGLGKIASIGLGQVTVAQGNKVSALQFAGDVAQSPDSPTQPNGLAIRPLMGAMPVGMH
jgi:type IV pilus biogenesis protein PilP